MGHTFDPVALQPSAAEGAGVAEARWRRAFGEPGVLAQQALESNHPPQVTRQPGHRHPGQVQPSTRVVVQLQRQVRSLALLDLGLDPAFQRQVLRLVFRVRRTVQVAVEIPAAAVESRPAVHHAVLVGHRQDGDVVALEEPLGVRIAGQQTADQPLHDPVADRLPGMRPRADENVMRCRRLANPDDLQLPALHRVPDRGDLHERVLADRVQPPLEVRQPIRLGPGDIELRTGHRHGQPHAIPRQRLERHRRPVTTILGNHREQDARRIRTADTIPDVEDVPELQIQRRSRAPLQLEMKMSGCAVGRLPLLIVQQVDHHGAVVIRLVPERRRVFEARIDILETDLSQAILDADRLGRVRDPVQRVETDLGESDPRPPRPQRKVATR